MNKREKIRIWFSIISGALSLMFMLYELYLEYTVNGRLIPINVVVTLMPIFLLIFGILSFNNARKNRRESQQLRAENDKMHVEYQFLKAQINPHFLYNTLNFFYSKALPVSDELSDGILTLSEIMRYSLSSDEDENGLVPLRKEVEQINNFIHINRLRFGERFSVIFNIKGDPSGKKIVPLALITLVENAFKHGETMDPTFPVEINLDVSQINGMVFSVTNKKKMGRKDHSHGIGLKSIRKQMDWVYKNNYTLNLKDRPETFIAQLRVTFAKEEIFFSVTPLQNNMVIILYCLLFFVILIPTTISYAFHSLFWENGHFLLNRFLQERWGTCLIDLYFLIFIIVYLRKYRSGGGLSISRYGIEFRRLQLINLNIDWEDVTDIEAKPYMLGYRYLIKVKSRKKYMQRLSLFERYVSGNLFSFKRCIRLNAVVLKEDKDYVLSIINKKWEEYKKQREVNQVLR